MIEIGDSEVKQVQLGENVIFGHQWQPYPWDRNGDYGLLLYRFIDDKTIEIMGANTDNRPLTIESIAGYKFTGFSGIYRQTSDDPSVSSVRYTRYSQDTGSYGQNVFGGSFRISTDGTQMSIYHSDGKSVVDGSNLVIGLHGSLQVNVEKV